MGSCTAVSLPDVLTWQDMHPLCASVELEELEVGVQEKVNTSGYLSKKRTCGAFFLFGGLCKLWFFQAL